MILEGLLILSIGMGVVFLFFLFLMLTMKLLQLLVIYLDKAFPESVPAVPQANGHATGETEAHVALAIAAAKRFRR